MTARSGDVRFDSMEPSSLLHEGEMLHRILSAAVTRRSGTTGSGLARQVAEARTMVRRVSTLLEGVKGSEVNSNRLRNADVIQLRALRTNLRRTLSQLTLSRVQEGSARDDDAAALHSLLRTRQMMAAEVDKVNEAVAALEDNAASVREVNSKLVSLAQSLSAAQQLVTQLVRVKTVEDVVLRISVLVFLAAVAYVWYQRLFGKFVTVISDYPR